MKSSLIYNFEPFITQIIETIEKEKGLAINAEEKKHIIENVSAALKKIYPKGISRSDLRPESPFLKKVLLGVTAALANEKNPNLRINLDLILTAPEEDLKLVFQHLFKQINAMRPTPRPLNKDGMNDQIDKQVDICLKSKDPELVLERAAIELQLFLLDQVLEQTLNAEANISGGATHREGEFRINAIQTLIGNILGVAAQGPAYLPVGILSDTELSSPNTNPDVHMQGIIRRESMGLLSAIVEAIGEAASRELAPRLGGPIA